jgi:hypothetical protein
VVWTRSNLRDTQDAILLSVLLQASTDATVKHGIQLPLDISEVANPLLETAVYRCPVLPRIFFSSENSVTLLLVNFILSFNQLYYY